jgi:beta-lactamase class A
VSDRNDEDALTEHIQRIGRDAGVTSVAVAFHDYRTGRHFAHRGGEWFHAASTIKIPVLLGVFQAVDDGLLSVESRVHVRNRFLSIVEETAYRVERARDAGADIHAQIGKTMRVGDLARQMIVTSSNLATNLLVDLVGIPRLQSTVQRFAPDGIELKRGVEDGPAHAKGIDNRVTASGLVRVLQAIEEQALSEKSCRTMLDILHDQEFRSGIPAGLPESARVAHKTGEISTIAHDTGLVYLPDREPYALAILTEWSPSSTSGRKETVASLSRAVFEHLASAPE